MKKLVAFVAVAVAAVAMAVADPLLVVHGNFNFLNAGTTWDSDIKKVLDQSDFKDSFNFSVGGGAGINIPFAGYFGFQPGVDFYYNSVGAAKDDNSYSYSYLSLEIPLLITIKYNKFNFAVGPYAVIPFGLQETSKVDDTTVTTKYDFKTAFNIGLEASAGYEERIGMGILVGSIGYKLDFLPVGHKGKDGTDDSDVFTRRGLFIDVGYKIPLSF